MHKIIGLVAVVLLLGFTTFALAKSENSNSGKGNGQSQGNQGQGSQNPNKEKNKDETASPDPSASVSASATPASSPSVTCDPNANWKNHGEYVSCVAKSGAGGQAVSEAAKSDIGKKKDNGTPSASLSPSPSSTASATPIATSSASPSPEATSSAVFRALEPVREAGKSVINSLRHLIEQFQALFSL